uniref:Uncharacterized protein n=1 Tax=Ciona savignyi TaxID=51511 RepID=H2Z018_CIOSA
MACCFGGGCLVNLCVGKPPLMPFNNSEAIFLASLVWWLVFYTPKNAFHFTVQWLPVSTMIMLLKELLRTKKIMKGVMLARSVYPSSYLICTLLGMLAACGGGFIKNLALLLTSQWSPNSIKTFQLSVLTKLCLLFSFVYVMQINGFVTLPLEVIALLQATTIFAYTIGNRLKMTIDPFATVESIMCSIFVDYTAFTRPNAEPSQKVTSAKAGDKKEGDKKAKNKKD